MKEQTYYRQLARNYFEGKTSEEEYRELYQFLIESKENYLLFKKWDAEYIQVAKSDPTLKKQWTDFEKTLEKQNPSLVYRIVTWVAQNKVAAIFILAFTLSVGLYFIPANEKIIFVENEYHFVPHGEIKTILLPDSSLITLNGGSTLFYPSVFSGAGRTIILNGEAYLQVTPDKSKPFVVRTSELDVQVLGTSFNISVYTHHKNVSVALESGLVQVQFHDTEEAYQLSPLEKISYNRASGEIVRASVTTFHENGWINGAIYFEDTTLAEVLERLQKQFDITIHVVNTNSLEKEVTVKFIQGETVEEVLSLLEKIIPGTRFRIAGKDVYVE